MPKLEWEYTDIYYDDGVWDTKKEKRPEMLQTIADRKTGTLTLSSLKA